QLWVRLNLLIYGLRVRATRLAPLDPSLAHVFMSNHRSQLDILAMVKALEDFQLRWVAKVELTLVPVFGWALTHSGHILSAPPDRGRPMRGGNAAGAPLRVIPLGGLGEIGLNLLVLEQGDTAIAIDCGVMFPDASMPGIDVAIPDVTYLRGLGERFRAIFLTHGHEDHIGALPYVLAERAVPVYGTPLTLGFVRERLGEHGISPTLAAYGAEPCRVGPFAVEPFAMTHSIPDSVGLAIRTPVGIVVHTGDFKLDQTPLDGRLPDIGRLAELGAEGVALLFSDSTNVEHAGITPSERSVGAELE